MIRRSQPGQETPPSLHVPLSLRKKILFASIPSVVLAISVLVIWAFFFPKRGSALCRHAWERTYVDRHVAIPVDGPREGGIPGKRTFNKPVHPATKWCEPAADFPGILEIDSEGRQFYHPKTNSAFQILIVGGSVAAGTFATTTATTYFGLLGTRLESEQSAAQITVFAGGAWKSVQDVAALEHSVQSGITPNLVVFINGLNDLTNGATTEALFGQQVPTKDGSRWNPLYHEHDYARRVAVYLRNMRTAATLARKRGMSVLFVLQPALFEREPLTKVERRLLAASLAPHTSKATLIQCYAQMRTELSLLADEQHMFFLDCSRVFNGETATTFADMWHFSDFGHQILATALTLSVKRALHASVSKPIDSP